MARYALIDRRFNRLCEFNEIPHGETADLFWVDVTGRPEITIGWKYFETTGEWTKPVELPAVEVESPTFTDYGLLSYTFDAGAGLPRHQHPFAHDHVVEAGKTVVVIEGQAPIFCEPGSPAIILPADVPHGITALENGTRFKNTRL